ncbi:uncharacterized protein [Dermacentor andersoni]|uniref:uncharacterized protein isoform X6 n=1 Tax=Dermacentor andersoni TaxID=34620 RepID=UPI003B3B577A
MLIKFFLIAQIVLSRTGFVDAGSEHALHQAYLLLPPAVCPAGFIGQNKSQEAVPHALHWDHLTSTVTSTETSWHPDKSSSLFDVPFSGLGSTERARMLIKFFLIAQRPSRASEKSLRYWREQTGFTELCFMSRWADTMSPDAVTLWSALCKDTVLSSLQLLKRQDYISELHYTITLHLKRQDYIFKCFNVWCH